MDKAESDLKELLAEHPSDVKARTDLGLFYFSAGRLDEAEAEFRGALETVPNEPVASYNLAATACARGDAGDALELLERPLENAPRNAMLHFGKGCALHQLQRQDEAIRSFQAALGLDESYAGAWYGLGTTYQAKGDEASAVYCFTRASNLDPEHPSARHMVNALAGNLAERPPAGFVRDLFDFYAANFEKHLLETLDYRAPGLLLEALHPRIHAREDLKVLDLGCGTGLFGAEIRAHAASLVGVDVSPAMLALAQDKSIYDTLDEADIVNYVSAAPAASFDVISAVDVFIYLGDLRRIVSGARDALRRDGLLAFTVEADTGEGYSLGRTGRYRHSPAFLKTLRNEFGLEELVFVRETLRMEGNAPCEGFVVVWRKLS